MSTATSSAHARRRPADARLLLGLFLTAAWAIAPLQAAAQPAVNKLIVVDQFGYRPGDAKVAVIVDPQTGHNGGASFNPGGTYQVRRWSDGSVVFSGSPSAWNGGATDSQAGDKGWWFDFSALNTPGSYYVYDTERDVRSHRFEIGENVYADVLKAAVRTYFYQRINFAKETPYADSRWTDGAAFGRSDQDVAARFVRDQGNAATERDLRGGWFDAGDYNKYVTFALEAVSSLLTAYQLNPDAFGDDFNIPESGNGIPDLLDELKYEMDWLVRMQDDDGGVFIKIGSLDFDEQSPPSSDTRPRFYEKKCSSSSIAAAAMYAYGAVVFAPFPSLQGYASDLERRAERAWTWYQSNPRSDSCDPQTVKAGDADMTYAEQDGAAVVAAVYLFAATGKSVYNNHVRDNYTTNRPWGDDTFGRYDASHGDALLYFTTLPNADGATKSAILSKLASQAANSHAYKDNAAGLYRAYMPDTQYHWGSNRTTSAYGNTNMQAVIYNQAGGTPGAYRTRALDHLHYLHGVNPHQRVYLSNMYGYGAEETVNEMYHRWFYNGTRWDNVADGPGPAPGYLVGGPNKNYGGSALPTSNGSCAYPPMKCYADTNAEGTQPWSLTEPGIYYQAAYVKLLSNFVSGSGSPPATGTFPQEGAWYTLRNDAGYLDTGSGGAVKLENGAGGTGRQWRFIAVGDGAYWIDNRRSGRGALDTSSGGAVRWTSGATPNGDDKHWTVEAAGDGTYRFRNVRGGRGLLTAGSDGTVSWGGSGAATRWQPGEVAQASVAEADVQAETATLVPTDFALEAAYPNPFNPQTAIRYALPERADVRLEVFDAMGRRVALLVEEPQGAGYHEATFEAASLASGMYLVRLAAGSFTATDKVLLVK